MLQVRAFYVANCFVTYQDFGAQCFLQNVKHMFTMKVAQLMDLPPVALIYGLPGHGNTEIYYPRPLLELWMRSTQIHLPYDSPSGQSSVICFSLTIKNRWKYQIFYYFVGRTSAPQPPEPVSSSARERVYQNPLEFVSFSLSIFKLVLFFSWRNIYLCMTYEVYGYVAC